MVADGGAALWVDRSCLLGVQYRTDANLSARQSIYAYQHPPLDLPRLVLDLAECTGHETVTDVGCGNGRYVAELARRGHTGRVLGVDLSVGMLAAARKRSPEATLLAGDAAALPLAAGSSSVTLAMHMLYHVPDQRAAVRELRRITRAGGRVLVGLNGPDHLRELYDLIAAGLRDIAPGHRRPGHPAGVPSLRLDQGEALLASVFTSVTRHDFAAELVVPGPGPVEDYVRSTIAAQNLPDPERLVSAISSRLSSGGRREFRIGTHTGCLVCS